MNIGDKVIVYKRNWFGLKKSGVLAYIFYLNDKSEVFRIYFYDEFGRYKSGCNIFINQGETIEIDKEEIRNDRLKELDI